MQMCIKFVQNALLFFGEQGIFYKSEMIKI